MGRTMGVWLALLVGVTGCGDDGDIDSDEEAELAYVGLDQAVARALKLGLKGYSEASNANIADQTESGEVGGTMVVGGQVDQGNSDNKTLSLTVTLTDYQDVVDLDPDDEHDDDDDDFSVVYDTPSGAPALLDLKLANMPDGTLTGTFVGTFGMTGDLEGEVTLDLALDGPTEADPDSEVGVLRVEGSTSVEGAATSEGDGDGENGVFEVDLTI